MKQVDTNRNIKASNEDTPIGAMSVTAILKELAENKNSLTYTIQQTFIPKFESFITVNKFHQIKLNTQLTKLNDTLSNIFDVLIGQESVTLANNKFQNTNADLGNKTVSDIFNKGYNFLMKDSLTEATNQIMNEINTNILTIISNQQLLIDLLQNNTKQTSKATPNSNDSKQDIFEQFEKIIESIQKNLDKTTLQNITKFLDCYIKFIDTNNTKKLMVVAIQLQRFAIFLRILGIQLNRTKNLFQGLTVSILTLTLAMLLPPFQIGFAYLIFMLRTLKITVGGVQGLVLFNSLKSVGMGIMMLVGGAYLMGKVNFGNIVKLCLALSMLAGVLKLFQKGKKKAKVPKTFGQQAGKATNWLGMGAGGSMLILSVAFGLIMIVAACGLASIIDWSKTTMLLGFMGALAVILIVMNKLGSNKSLGMFGFAAGLALIVLSVDATNELDWSGALKLITFIGGIALTLAIVSRIGGGGKFSGMLGFAAGLALLILCIDASKELDWDYAWDLIKFIVGITLAIRIAGGRKAPGLIKFALGLALIILCVDATRELDFNNAYNLLGFILSLSFVLFISAKLLKLNITLLIGLLAGSITSFIIALTFRLISDKNVIAAWKVLAVIGGVVMLLKFAESTLAKNIKLTSLVGMLIIMSIFSWIGALTDDAINFVKIVNLFSIIAVVYAFIYALNLQNKLLGTKLKVTEILSGIVIAALEGFIFAFWSSLLVNLDLNKVSMLILAIVSFIGVLWIISKMKKPIETACAILTVGGMLASVAGLVAVVTMISIGLAPGVFSVASVILLTLTIGILIGILWLINKFKKDITIGSVISLTLVGAIVLLATGMAIFGIFSPLIMAGSAAMIVSAVALAVFVGICFLLSLASTAIVIGAGVLIVISVTLLFFAGAMAAITAINPDNEKIQAFITGISILAVGLFLITPQLIIGAVAAAVAIIVAVASIVVAGALYVVSELKVNVENIKLFGKAIVKLTEAYGECGLWAITKAVVKAALLIPISITTLITALALRAISALEIKESKLNNFAIVLSKFITLMCDIVGQHAKEIESNKKAFKILADMANAAGSIVNIIESMANMTVGVWGIDKQTGELKMIDKRQINDNDFDLITRNMGKMLQALIQPLSIISSDDDIWDFGTIKVKNPFGKSGFFSSGDMSGVNRIKAIGDAFEKIPAIIQAFCNNPLLTDVTDEGSIKMQRLQENIGTFFDTIIACMNKLPQKSVLSNWFDGTASWLEDTVQPVFNSSTIVLDGLHKSLFWKTPNLNVLWPRVIGFFDTTKYVAQTVNDSKKYKMPKSFAKEVIDFYNELNKLSTNQWLSSANVEATSIIALNTKSLVNTLGDSGKFNQLNKNLQNTDKNIKSIVGNINKINVSKAAALERNLKLLTQAKSQEALREAIEQLKEMIGLLKDVQEKQVSATNFQTNQFAQHFDTDNAFKANLSKTSDERNSEILIVLQKLQALFEGTGIHVETNLAGVSDEIVQALHEAGLTDKVNSGWKGFGK